MQVALQDAALVQDMCLPRLETLELYLWTPGLSFEPDSPLAHRQGVRGVCTEIGNMVSMGVLPSLKQVEPTTPCIRTRCGAFRYKTDSASEIKFPDH